MICSRLLRRAGPNGNGGVGSRPAIQRPALYDRFLGVVQKPVTNQSDARAVLLLGDCELAVFPANISGSIAPPVSWNVDADVDATDVTLAAISLLPKGTISADAYAFVRLTLRASATGNP